MKKLTIILAILVLGATRVIAEEGTVSSPTTRTGVQIRQEVRQEAKETRQEVRQQIQEQRKEVREAVASVRQETRSKVAENHANRLEFRFNFYVERFNDIIERFQTRLTELTNSGKDVSAVQAKLDAAKAKLAEAQAKGKEAVAAFRAIDPAKFSEQKTEALAARDLANQARTLFSETGALLKQALRELKNISKPALPAASAAVEKTGGTQ